jgi:hypothetical protein
MNMMSGFRAASYSTIRAAVCCWSYRTTHSMYGSSSTTSTLTATSVATIEAMTRTTGDLTVVLIHGAWQSAAPTGTRLMLASTHSLLSRPAGAYNWHI